MPNPPCSFALGSIKAEHQNVVMPEMTVLIRRSLPANDRDFTVQEESRFFICWRRGSQLRRFNFLELRGTPRYRTG